MQFCIILRIGSVIDLIESPQTMMGKVQDPDEILLERQEKVSLNFVPQLPVIVVGNLDVCLFLSVFPSRQKILQTQTRPF